MADKKISQLTAATTPLAGTEVLPIVQGGTTVKATVNNVLAPIQVTATRAGVNTAPTFSFHILGLGEFGGVLAQSNVAGATSFTLQQGVTGVSNSGVSLRNADSAYDWLRFAAVGGDVSVQTGNLVVGTAGKGIDFSANTHAAGMTSELLDWYEEGDWTPSFTGWSANPTTAYAKYTRIGRMVYLNAVFLSGTTAGGASIGGLPFSSGASNGSGVSAWTVANPSVQISGQIATYASSIANINAVTISGDYWCLSVFYLVD